MKFFSLIVVFCCMFAATAMAAQTPATVEKFTAASCSTATAGSTSYTCMFDDDQSTRTYYFCDGDQLKYREGCDSCSADATCDETVVTDYAADGTTCVDTSCGDSLESFKFTCELYTGTLLSDCTAPGTPGYTVTETNLRSDNFDVTATCATGYFGTASVTQCDSAGDTYALAGCEEILCQDDTKFVEATSTCSEGGCQAGAYSADATNTPCARCTIVDNAAVGATYTCDSATNSRVSACAVGYYKDSTGAVDVCTACDGATSGTWSAGNEPFDTCSASFYDKTGTVTAYTVCTLEQYQTAAPTATSDRTCAACAGAASGTWSVGNEPYDTCFARDFYDKDGTVTALTVCGEKQFQSTAPTTTSDRACTDCEANCDACTDATTCTECSEGFFLSAGDCIACDAHCDKCVNADKCCECDDEYDLSTDLASATTNTCQAIQLDSAAMVSSPLSMFFAVLSVFSIIFAW